jgi:hypothetical protein
MCVIQRQVRCIHQQKHHTPEEMVCHNPTTDHGGVRLRVGLRFYTTFYVKQSGSLKEVTMVMESEPTR